MTMITIGTQYIFTDSRATPGTTSYFHIKSNEYLNLENIREPKPSRTLHRAPKYLHERFTIVTSAEAARAASSSHLPETRTG